MPRTRSLAWSELKIGVLTIVALVIAARTGTLSTDANESGPITSLEQGRIGQASPQTRLHVFGRCGHWTQIEHADAFNRLVLDFLTA